MDELRQIETWYPDLEKPNKHGLPDAIHADFVLPEVVTILAPGRKGRFFWKQASGLTIAVNSAIDILGIDFDFWFVADRNAAKHHLPWLTRGLEYCDKYGRPTRRSNEDEHGSPLKIFSEDINEQLEEDWGDYTFYMMPNKDDQVLKFMLQPYRQDAEVFRATESIAGIAIDFAVRYGAKVINLLGVDMEGGYYDDPPGLNRDVVNGYVFLQLQKEIDYFKKRGILFKAISPTRLKI